MGGEHEAAPVDVDRVVRLRRAGEGACAWVLSTTVETERGPRIPARPGDPTTAGGASLYSGTPGVILLFLEAYRSTGDSAYLDVARSTAESLVADFGSVEESGLYTGLAGCGFAIYELRRVTGDAAIDDDLQLVVRMLAERAEIEGGGANWGQFTELLWGTSGVALFLLDVADLLGDDQATELARRAGEWLLGQGEPAAIGGVRYGCGEGVKRRNPNWTYVSPSMSHGTAGVAYFLATLGSRVEDLRYVDAALEAADYVTNAGRFVGNGWMPFHHEPDATEEFHYGWCHGPTGVADLFHRLEQATGDVSWGEWRGRCAVAVLESGIPERKHPGFWDNVGRCCGSAGVADLFIDLHRVTGIPEHLAFAVRVADDILQRETVDSAGTRWSNVEHKADPPELPAYTGFMHGAAGIGMLLFRLERYLRGIDDATRLPHSPF